MKTKLLGSAALVTLIAAAPVAAATHRESLAAGDLADLDLEQLSRITVTSASRRAEPILHAAASIYVITAEDIRRSGATSIPEALRIAPNAQVVRGDASQYVVTTRGGIEGLANKMLVLVDGRTVYSPLFSGVFWDAITVSVEDIERIEVISGPGATLWGTNAVNGVINVTTKSAASTQGYRVSAGAGDAQKGIDARLGATTDGGIGYRVFTRYYERDATRLSSGASARDAQERWTAGFRGERRSGRDEVVAMGEAFRGDIGNLEGARDARGAYLLARWRQDRGPGSELFVQAYYDRTEREHAGSFQEKRDTVDIEAHHAWVPSENQRLVWGAGYRLSRDRTVPTAALGFVPPGRDLALASFFAQDEARVNERLTATLGLRAEHNGYTGVEWMPNARLSWTLSPDHVVWSALSRAVRAPSRLDRDLVIPGFPPHVLAGNESFQAEVARVGEVGYRGRLGSRMTLSLTAFHHDFRDLRIAEPAGSAYAIANGARGRRSGLEGWGDIAVTRDWRISWGFTAMRHRYAVEPGRVDILAATNGNDPKRTAIVRSLWDLGPSHELDVLVRYRGALPDLAVPSHTVVDVRWGWRVARNLELSLLVSNALDRRHAEYAPLTINAVFERQWFLKATWRI